MKFTPREYTPVLEDHMLDVKRGALFVPMGFGKTVNTLNVIDTLQMAGIETKPTLVLAPKRVAQSTWPDEVAKWDHLNHMEVQPILGTAEERRAALLNKNAGIFTINYENVPWMIETLNGKWPFGMCVADESTKLKNLRLTEQTSTKGKVFIKGGGGSIRARAIGKVAHQCSRWVNLTGTPVPNGLIDLWGQTWVLDKGQRLGRTFEGFKSRWFQSVPAGEYTKVQALPYANDQISAVLKDICISLRVEDYFDVREPIVTKVMIDLPAKAMSLYKDMEKKMFMQLQGYDVEAFNAASKTQKCLQLANGAVYVDPDVADDEQPKARKFIDVHDLKLQALESIVAESGGESILVAYWFKSDLARLMKAFPQGRRLDDNPQTIRDWNAGQIPLLFVHPASAGHGLSLQMGGRILVYMAINWNLELMQQVLERIGPVRQMQSGFDRAVLIYYILARHTLDEEVLERIETKASVQDILRNAMRRRKIAPC